MVVEFLIGLRPAAITESQNPAPLLSKFFAHLSQTIYTLIGFFPLVF